MTKVLVSIIIASKNCLAKLQNTLENIKHQSYKYIEVIVIDSASNDGTKHFLHNTDLVTSFVCEPDSGISDAFNKGVARASGSYIYFMGAGDSFYHPDALFNLLSELSGKSDDDLPDLLCGKVAVATASNAVKHIAPAIWPLQHQQVLRKYMIYPHQGLLMHRRYFITYGFFDLRLRYAMDYELLLRSYHDNISTIVSDEIIAYWQDDGIGANCTDKVLSEYHKIRLWNHIAPRWQLYCLWQWQRLKALVKSLVRVAARQA